MSVQPVPPPASTEFRVAAYNAERIFNTNSADDIDFNPATGKTETSEVVDVTPAAYSNRLAKVSGSSRRHQAQRRNRLRGRLASLQDNFRVTTDAVMGDIRPMPLVLQSGIFLLLSIACVNMSELLLVRRTSPISPRPCRFVISWVSKARSFDKPMTGSGAQCSRACAFSSRKEFFA
jgi:hypothetical protein